MRIAIAMFAMLLLAGTASAVTIHVPVDQPTIAAGLGAATAGDTVLVACGTYYESGLEMTSGVTLRSEAGTADCVTIDATGATFRVIMFDNTLAGTRIEGITCTGGTSPRDPACTSGTLWRRSPTAPSSTTTVAAGVAESISAMPRPR